MAGARSGSRARPGTKPPLLDAILLEDLADADGTALGAGDSVEGQRYTDCSLDGRDLTGIRWRECEFRRVSFHGATLRGASVAECVATELHAAVFSAPRSTWRDVRVERSRLGSVELYDSTLRGVALEACKLDFVNLRTAQLHDVLISDCVIEELDLGGATVQRLELQNCRIGTLDVTRATLKDVDLRGSDFSVIRGLEGLRGATIDDAQLGLLAPILADHLGIVVE